MRIVFIAEKPDIAAAMAGYIWDNHPRKLQTHYIGKSSFGDETIVTWAYGHILMQAMPEKYGEQFKKFDTYPIIPNKWINDLQRKDYLEQIFNSFIKSLESLDGNKDKENSKIKINIDKKILQDTINDLKNNPDACKIGGGNEVDGIIHMPYSDPGKQLSEFMKYFYEIQLGDTNYVENMKLTQNKDVSTLNFDEICTELTAIIRAERFVSGAWYSAVESGRLLELLERLNDLVDNV